MEQKKNTQKTYNGLCSHLQLNNTSTGWERMLNRPIFVSISFYCSPGMRGGAASLGAPAPATTVATFEVSYLTQVSSGGPFSAG